MKWCSNEVKNIIIVDSGMGGLDVAARLYERFRALRVAVHLAFVNVRPPPGKRFEDVSAPSDKICLLDDLLKSTTQRLPMDLLAMACNSLSVLTPSTRFYCEYRDQIQLISDVGIDALCNELHEGYIYVLGTALTIQSALHLRALVANGVDENRIVAQACPGLANSIQEDHQSVETSLMIEHYVQRALEQRHPGLGGSATAFLACSHYGYVRRSFQECFQRAGINHFRVLEANGAMVDALERRVVTVADTKHGPSTGLPSIRVYTFHSLGGREQQSLLELVRPISVHTAEALERIEVLQ